MNKAKRSRWCNPLKGVGIEEGVLRFWVLQLLERGRGAQSPPSIYILGDLRNTKRPPESLKSNKPKLRTNPNFEKPESFWP